METSLVHISVRNVAAVQRGKLAALVSADIEIEGVLFTLHGIQVRVVRHEGKLATSINLPCYRDNSGEWCSAISIPDEVREPLANIVIAACMELGILVYSG